MIDIIERFSQSKDGIELHCEDIITVTDDFACVVDGATAKYDLVPRSGRLAAEIISSAIPLLRRRADISEVLDCINLTFEQSYKAQDLYAVLEADPIKRPSASFALYSKYYRTVWLIGDCQCFVDTTKYTNAKSIDAVLANTRAVFLELCLAQGYSTEALLQQDLGREFIRPLLEKQQLFLNTNRSTEYTYTSLDGFLTDVSDVKCIPVGDDAEFVVLASDGYPELYPSLNESEAYLKTLLEEDPLCFRRYKSTKGVQKGYRSFDDRAYLKIKP